MKHYSFELGHNSFGEIYHVAMHGVLIPKKERKHFGILMNEPFKSDICDFLDDIRVSYSKKRTKHHRGLSETANTIFERFHVDTVEKTKKRILEIAERRDWKFPFADIATPDPKILIWQRNESYKPHRNSSISLVRQLVEMAINRKVIPVIIGPDRHYADSYPLVDFHKDSFFSTGHNICKQLWFQHMLFTAFGVKASVGMMSGAMDGAAMFFGHKTIFFARERDASPRMAKVAEAIPALHWMDTEYDEYLANLNDQQMNDLQDRIWPKS